MERAMDWDSGGPLLAAAKSLSSKETLTSYLSLLGLSCPACQMYIYVNVGRVGWDDTQGL